ncbi:IS3 family transposase [Paenibacillus athensensis]|uniref:Integrase catalytic domain-containing protein n=1 Tax=Paenibacillus athensensis TaxID=1967502 RepID=A0A4Y8PRF4_9BACL|nr:IS3 family transposase [Paenibacillus athensensis]
MPNRAFRGALWVNAFALHHLPQLHQLKLELYDYVNWFNKHRIHGTLGT